MNYNLQTSNLSLPCTLEIERASLDLVNHCFYTDHGVCRALNLYEIHCLQVNPGCYNNHKVCHALKLLASLYSV